MKEIHIHSAAGVDKGNVRKNNEDNIYFNGIHLNPENREKSTEYLDTCSDKIQIYAICDGMGGEDGGEEASLIAVETLYDYSIKNIDNICDFDKYIEKYLLDASNAIYSKSQSIGNKRMGTTIALLCVVNGEIRIYNVGDSRIYRLHRNKLTQLTEDHTQAMRLLRLGAIKIEDVKTHPCRNKLIQYLGISSAEMTIKPNILHLPVVNKDMYLLCSDGLTDMVSDDEIKEIMKQSKTQMEVVNNLIEKAKINGGRDNISAIVLTVKVKRKWFK